MSTLVKLYDPLVRKFLSNISVAKDFLKIHLPAVFKASCNMDSLKIEAGSYIEEDLQVHYSDIVYKLELYENKGSAYIYILLEH